MIVQYGERWIGEAEGVRKRQLLSKFELLLFQLNDRNAVLKMKQSMSPVIARPSATAGDLHRHSMVMGR